MLWTWKSTLIIWFIGLLWLRLLIQMLFEPCGIFPDKRFYFAQGDIFRGAHNDPAIVLYLHRECASAAPNDLYGIRFCVHLRGKDCLIVLSRRGCRWSGLTFQISNSFPLITSEKKLNTLLPALRSGEKKQAAEKNISAACRFQANSILCVRTRVLLVCFRETAESFLYHFW